MKILEEGKEADLHYSINFGSLIVLRGLQVLNTSINNFSYCWNIIWEKSTMNKADDCSNI
jgi:hypothetical protein